MDWEWLIEGRAVTAEISMFTGREVVRVDGVEVFNAISMRLRSEVPIALPSGRSALVVVRIGNFLLPTCELILDGAVVAPKRGPESSKAELAWWQWLLVGMCAIIPILTMGGALPALIGIGGASTNWKLATSNRSTGTKALLMGAVAVSSWLVLAVVLTAVSSMG